MSIPFLRFRVSIYTSLLDACMCKYKGQGQNTQYVMKFLVLFIGMKNFILYHHFIRLLIFIYLLSELERLSTNLMT